MEYLHVNLSVDSPYQESCCPVYCPQTQATHTTLPTWLPASACILKSHLCVINALQVHIIGHIPPGLQDCLKAWSWNYYSVINR